MTAPDYLVMHLVPEAAAMLADHAVCLNTTVEDFTDISLKRGIELARVALAYAADQPLELWADLPDDHIDVRRLTFSYDALPPPAELAAVHDDEALLTSLEAQFAPVARDMVPVPIRLTGELVRTAQALAVQLDTSPEAFIEHAIELGVFCSMAFRRGVEIMLEDGTEDLKALAFEN